MDEVPELPGFIPVAAVSERYGVHKGTIYYMIFSSKRFKTVFKVTRGAEDQRPVLLLDENEVRKVMAERQRDADSENPKELAAWNRRVKDWGRAGGWHQTPISISGPPQLALVEQYLKAHPEDVKPG